MSKHRNILTGGEWNTADAAIAIDIDEYNHLVRCEIMLMAIINAQAYNRESLVAATKTTLEELRKVYQSDEDAPAEEAGE